MSKTLEDGTQMALRNESASSVQLDNHEVSLHTYIQAATSENS